MAAATLSRAGDVVRHARYTLAYTTKASHYGIRISGVRVNGTRRGRSPHGATKWVRKAADAR